MKRLIAFLLVCVFLLASCSRDGGEISGASSAESSDGSESSATESGAEESAESGESEVFEYKTLVSVGKSYTVTAEADKTYPDIYSQQLTDGILACDNGVSYLDAKLIGYTSDESINIDLGDDGKSVYEFTIRLLAMNVYGIGLPKRVTVYFSDDGEDWTRQGDANIDEYVDHTMCYATLTLDKSVDTRYVRFRVIRSGGFFFTDEAMVYADVPPKAAEGSDIAEIYTGDSNDYTAITNLTTGVTAVKTYSKNVAAGASYTIDAAGFDERAPEDDAKLTDGGIVPSHFENAVWVGLSGEGTPSVTIDLGKAYDNLYSFKLYALGEGISIKYPDYVDFYASQNGTDYYIIGRVYAPDACSNYTYTINLAMFIKARYIKFAFAPGDGYYWFEEAEVYAGSDKSFGGGNLYPDLSLPVVGNPEYWSSGEADYNTVQNLIAGKTQQISSSIYLEAGSCDDTPQTTKLLTDGKYARSTDCYSGEWFEISNTGGSRDIFYDLEKTSTITGFKISILRQSDWGVQYPEYIKVYLSDNGTDWYTVFSEHKANETVNGKVTALEYNLKTPYSARFVRIMLLTGGFCFIDEIEVYGTKAVTEQTKSVSESGITPVTFYTRISTDNYANNVNTPVKADNIALVFGDQGDENTLLPYVAYLDEEGNIKDTFMDGFLYTPSSGTLTSGRTAIGDTVMADWKTFYNVTFDGINGLDKLNSIVGTVKDTLGLDENYKVYVYISLLNISDAITNFGDVDGDGTGENLSTAEGRRKAVTWFLKLCSDTFTERGYKNIALDGFYWLDEAVKFEKDNSAIMTEVGGYIHEFGSNYLWIPYYTANKYNFCGEMGFDLVCMQPNYSFDLASGLSKFTSTVDFALKYGMCVELEVAYQSYGDLYYVSRYLDYLYYGCVYGYMENGTHIYYDDSNFFAKMCYSTDFLPRLQYYYTYLYANKTLKSAPDTREALAFECSSGAVYNDKLADYDEAARYNIGVSSSHGSVTVNADGTFSYYPYKDFTGNDTFTYTYDNYLGESAECTVSLTVK